MNTTFDIKEAAKHMLAGLRIKSCETGTIFFLDSDFYVVSDEDEDGYNMSYFITSNKDILFQLADKNLALHYKPKIIWEKIKGIRTLATENALNLHWYPSKEEYLDSVEELGIKVLKWEEEYLPTTWEECE